MSDVTLPPPPPPAGGPSGAPAYPIDLEYERDYDVQNWRPLVNWLLAIPHWIVLYLLGMVAFTSGLAHRSALVHVPSAS